MIEVAGSPRPDRWLILAITTFAIFLTSLDSTIVVVALPTITRGLHSSPTAVLWTLTGYMLVSTVMLLPTARISDLVGRKTVFLSGFLVFAAASFLCGQAHTVAFLIAMRLVQGLGGAVLASVGPPIITAVFPPSELGRALGLNSAAWVTGSLLGPVAGGLLLAWTAWPAIFYVVIPFAIVAIILGSRHLPSGGAHLAGPWQWAHLDLPGTGLLTAALTALLVALTEGVNWGWTTTGMLVLYGVAVGGTILFIAREQRAAHPLFDLRLFRNVRFSLAQVILLLGALGIGAISYLITYYLQDGLALTPVLTGILLIPLAAPQLVTSPLGGWLADHVGPERPIVAGLFLVTVAVAGLSRLPAALSVPFILVMLGLIGIANGGWFPPLLKVVMSSAPREGLGAASGMFFTARNTAYSLSLTLALVFSEVGLPAALSRSIFVENRIPHAHLPRLELIHALSGALSGFAILSAVATLLALVLLRLHRAATKGGAEAASPA